MDTTGLLAKTNPLSYESMLQLCKAYNHAVDKLIAVRLIYPLVIWIVANEASLGLSQKLVELITL